MSSVECPGLQASWLNGWLAAIGTTVLDPRIRLGWTSGRTPVALLEAAGVDPVAAMVAAWPSQSTLKDMPLAENWKGAGKLQRHVRVEDFAIRARASRGHEYSWTLSSALSDLHVDDKGLVAHGTFDPAGPGSTKWLHHRLTKVHRKVEPVRRCVEDSFAGLGRRVKDNGLGFDWSRLGSLADASSKWIDPVIEELAFFGLALFPVRGSGTQGRSRPSRVQRGWEVEPDRRGERFVWPAWEQPLDRFGIDALLDAWRPENRARWPLYGVQAAWRTLAYKPRGDERTTAFGSHRL